MENSFFISNFAQNKENMATITYLKEEQTAYNLADDLDIHYQTERGKPMPSNNHSYLQLEWLLLGIGFPLSVW